MLLNLGYGYGVKRPCNRSTPRSNTVGSTAIFFFCQMTTLQIISNILTLHPVQQISTSAKLFAN